MESYNMWPFVSGFFIYHNVFKVHPSCSVYQYFVPYCMWAIFHHMCISHFVYASSADGQLDLFHMLVLMNNATIKIVSASIWNSLECVVEFLGHMVTPFLTFWQTNFSKAVAPFCTPTSNASVYQFLHILTNTYFPLLIYYYSHFSECDVSLWFWFAWPLWLTALSIFSYAYWPFLY